MNNIHPIFDTLLQKKDKEALLKQHSIAIWMVGLSGSGKSTLARGLENALHEKGYLTMLLDGDNLRTGVNSNLGFSEDDRIENIRRAAEVTKLFVNNGIITICSLISPTEAIRSMAKNIIGDTYREVFINCPFDVCAERDVKGLYKKALNGEIKNFTGLDSPFEEPTQPWVDVPTHQLSFDQSLDKLLTKVLTEVSY